MDMNNKEQVDILKYIGNKYQVFGTRHYRLLNGSNYNTRAIDIRTGSGFDFTILPDRGLDLSLASYKGVNLTYLTPNGEVFPAYYESNESEWLRTFFAGLLTTCGTANIGQACKDIDGSYGLHGRFSVTPAKNVCDLSTYENKIKVIGEIENSILFGEKIRIRRTIEAGFMEKAVTIRDEVENYGFNDAPLMLLYHINFGYPLLNEATRILVDSNDVVAYDDYSKSDIANIMKFSPPSPTSAEKNYFHTLRDFDGYAYAAVFNLQLSMGVYIKFNINELPYLSQWKLENPVDYVLALEPCNTMCLGRAELRRKNMLPIIKAGRKLNTEITIGILDGLREMQNFSSMLNITVT